MYRIIVAACILAVFLIGCTQQPTPTPTQAPQPPTATPEVPTEPPTATPLPPTFTPTPTPAPPTPTPTAVPITGSVIARLNVRQLPLLTGKLLGILNKDDAVTLTGRTTDNAWLQIYYPITQTDTNGWVISRLVQSSPLSQTLPTFNLQGTPVAALAAGTPTAAATPGGATAVATTGAPTAAATPTVLIIGGTPPAGETTAPVGTTVPTTPTVTSTPKATVTGTPGAKASGSIIFDTFVNGQYHIYRVRADGTGLQQLLQNLSTGASQPALSPNGQLLAYRRQTGVSGAGIAIANLDGTNERIIVGTPEASYPTWSPDGNNIAYSLAASPGQIYWISISDQTQTGKVALGFRPAWQPGGNNILFDGCDFTGANCGSLHVNKAFDADVTNPTLVTAGTNGAWSPGGSQIAYQLTDGNQNTNLYVASSNGSNKRQVTNGTGHNGLPIWSANGQWLFYRTDQSGTSWAIYAVRLDGSSAYKIVDAPVSGDNWVYEKLAIAP